eukprot:1155212-Pelagomonas_calceolata.AAC.2
MGGKGPRGPWPASIHSNGRQRTEGAVGCLNQYTAMGGKGPRGLWAALTHGLCPRQPQEQQGNERKKCVRRWTNKQSLGTCPCSWPVHKTTAAVL